MLTRFQGRADFTLVLIKHVQTFVFSEMFLGFRVKEQCFPLVCAPKKHFGNNVSVTMFPRLRGPSGLISLPRYNGTLTRTERGLEL